MRCSNRLQRKKLPQMPYKKKSKRRPICNRNFRLNFARQEKRMLKQVSNVRVP
jgi:hypothetical protein